MPTWPGQAPWGLPGWSGCAGRSGVFPAAGAVFEVGSAGGRDALTLTRWGYTVQTSDAAEGFFPHLRASGFSPVLFDVTRDPIPSGYPLVLANAVLHHLPPDTLETVLLRAASGLGPGTRLAFTVKAGAGQEWEDAKLGAPRYFCRWTAGALGELVDRLPRVRLSSLVGPADGWLYVVLDWAA